MGKRNRHRKGKGEPETSLPRREGAVTTDPRFTKVHSDPRFLKPNFSAHKVKVDTRFKAIFEEGMDFENTAKVDKYGRKPKGSAKEDMRQFYQLEEASNGELGSDKGEPSSEEAEHRELIFARSRGEVLIGSDSDTDPPLESGDSTEGEYDYAEPPTPEVKDDIPLGDKTRRFAVLSMDWDNIKAKDLFKVFNSVKPEAGVILSVKVYPSEFGKERMEYENLHGPPKEIFENPDPDSEAGSDGETLIQEDEGDEFNQDKLRQYQLERLKYYYAVVECDAVATAAAIYEQCDGGEFESTANFFDLRFIPDDMEFQDPQGTQATAANRFVTSALTNSKVELTWDQEDPERIKLVQRSFTTEDIDTMNFDALLASGSEAEAEPSALREKYLSLIRDASADEGSGSEMEITFAPGLSESNVDAPHQESGEETTVEIYLRKQREKLKAKKQARLQKPEAIQGAETKATKKAREDAERAELELVMLEDRPDARQHFDMRQVLKAEKQAARKGRRRGKVADPELAQDGFKIDTQDPRFAALYSSHHFAIDPTNPHFKKTQAMKELLAERQKKNPYAHDEAGSPNGEVSTAASQRRELANLVNS
ncbi:pre-rRNA-processing protein esf1, partial [Massospora cicadina]